MSLKNELIKEMFRMSPAAAQQASTKAPSHKLTCWTQPNPTQPIGQPNPRTTLIETKPSRPRPEPKSDVQLEVEMRILP